MSVRRSWHHRKPIFKKCVLFHFSILIRFSSKLSNIERISFVNFICFARNYFNINATGEMLEEWRPMMCPYDMAFNDAVDRFNLFLPSIFTDQQIDHGFK